MHTTVLTTVYFVAKILYPLLLQRLCKVLYIKDVSHVIDAKFQSVKVHFVSVTQY